MNKPERTKYFDRYVESVDVVLSQPEVKTALGGIATKLWEMNSRAFLPNERNGQFVVPRKQRDAFDLIAIAPLDEGEAQRFFDMSAPIIHEVGPWEKMGDYASSPVSGLSRQTSEVLEEYQHLNNRLSQAEKVAPNDISEPQQRQGGLSHRIEAIMQSYFQYGTDDKNDLYHAIARPVIGVKADMLKGLDEYNISATLAHELAHALDAQTNPIQYRMLIGNVASELAAFRISHDLYNMTGQEFESRHFTNTVESWRQQNMSPDAPFIPTREQAKYAREVLGV